MGIVLSSLEETMVHTCSLRGAAFKHYLMVFPSMATTVQKSDMPSTQ